MKRPPLPPSVKGTAQVVDQACKISKRIAWLKSLQVESRFQTLIMTSSKL